MSCCWMALVLLLGLLTITVSATSLPNCQDDASIHSSCTAKQQSQPPAAVPARKWFGFGAAIPWYPRGDCATECSWNPAPLMRHCSADTRLGIPETWCKPVGDAGVCPTMRYLDAVLPESYCIPRFEADCSHPDNIGCSSRCILYIIINHHCVADAYDVASGRFNTSCVYCNLCWDRSGLDTAAARKVPYAVMRARSGAGSLTQNHWLVLPKAPCIGIESTAPGCTDATGEYLWASAYSEAISLGFKYNSSTPDWALMVNAPNRRGVHQLHIHIANFDSQRSAPDIPGDNWLVRRLAAQQQMSMSASKPTRVLGEGYYNPLYFNSTSCSRLGRPPRNWARAYAVFVPSEGPVRDLGKSIRPWDLGRRMSAASDLPAHGYGMLMMSKRYGTKNGLVIAITWSTDDVEQLDVSEMAGDPIGYSHTCQNYIGAEGGFKPIKGVKPKSA